MKINCDINSPILLDNLGWNCCTGQHIVLTRSVFRLISLLLGALKKSLSLSLNNLLVWNGGGLSRNEFTSQWEFFSFVVSRSDDEIERR